MSLEDKFSELLKNNGVFEKDKVDEKDEKTEDENKDENKEDINEGFSASIPESARKIIKELSDEKWSSGKKSIMEAIRRFSELAKGNENISKAYFGRLDAQTSLIGESVIKKFKLEGDEKVIDDKKEKKVVDKKVDKKKEKDIVDEDISTVFVDDNNIKDIKKEGMLGLSKYLDQWK